MGKVLKVKLLEVLLEMDKQIEHIHELLDALSLMHDQADQDCPAEYRTSHFRQAFEDSYDLIVELTQVYGTSRAHKEKIEDYQAAYDGGHNAGYDEGHSVGYDQGYKAAYTKYSWL